jgi:hypothetical protein
VEGIPVGAFTPPVVPPDGANADGVGTVDVATTVGVDAGEGVADGEGAQPVSAATATRVVATRAVRSTSPD